MARQSRHRGSIVVVLSSTSLVGLCAGSLAPLLDSGGRAVNHGDVNNAVRRQGVWGQDRVHSSRRRQRPLTTGGGRAADAAEQGIFNSFSLVEREPSSFQAAAVDPPPGGQQQEEVPGRHRQQHEEHDRSGGGGGGGGAELAPCGNNHNNHCGSCADDTSSAEVAAAAGDGLGGHNYYPGRGMDAAQTLAGRSHGNFDWDDRFYGYYGHGYGASGDAPFPHRRPRQRHRHHLSIFGGAGAGPFGWSSSSSRRYPGDARRHRSRRRVRGTSSSASKTSRRGSPTAAAPAAVLFSPAAAATAAATAGLVVRVAAAAALALAVLAPLAAALSSHWAYFVAGGACAAISHTAAVPLDVIKTRIQCAPPGVEYNGTWDALVRICRSEGGRVLFCGAGATLVGYALQGSLKFGFFEFLKPVFAGLFSRGAGVAAKAAAAAASSAPILPLIAASVTAEIVGSSVLTPLEAARIRMVADSAYAPGLRSAIGRMIEEEGVSSLTRGLPALLSKQVPYTVTKLVTFDYLVRTVASRLSGGRGGGRGKVGTGVGVTVACAVIAGMLSSLASQPGDSLLSALNNEGRSKLDAAGGGGAGAAFGEVTSDASSEEEEQGRSSGEGAQSMVSPIGAVQQHQKPEETVEPVARAMLRIVREIGLLGLFRGMGARMMHVTSIVTVQLLIYQSIKRIVGIES